MSVGEVTTEVLARAHYDDADTVRSYAAQKELFPAEAALLHDCRAQIEGARVLDLGCGAGRTSHHLAPLAASYVGLDYASNMVEACRSRHPDLKFVHGNACDLRTFEKDSFDFVLFSYNGIDSMQHVNRMACLAAVRRVLSAGGYFAFSSHNRDYSRIVRSIDWPNFVRGGIRYNVRCCLSFLRAYPHEVTTEDYAILSDPRAGFGQLNYFITKAAQCAQLEAAGFSDILLLDWAGRWVDRHEPDTSSMSFYYLCRKGTSESDERES